MRGVQHIWFYTACCYNDPWSSGCPVTLAPLMLDLMELPINAEGRPAPHTSLEGGIPSGQSKPVWCVWWRGWWERGCSSHCLANFRLKALTRSWVSVFTEVKICWTYELAALLLATWLAPKAIGCSWPVCLTCCFHPSCWTSSLARNLSAIELPTWLLRLSGDTGGVISSSVAGVIRSWEPPEEFIWCCHLLTMFPSSALWV